MPRLRAAAWRLKGGDDDAPCGKAKPAVAVGAVPWPKSPCAGIVAYLFPVPRNERVWCPVNLGKVIYQGRIQDPAPMGNAVERKNPVCVLCKMDGQRRAGGSLTALLPADEICRNALRQ